MFSFFTSSRTSVVMTVTVIYCVSSLIGTAAADGVVTTAAADGVVATAAADGVVTTAAAADGVVTTATADEAVTTAVSSNQQMLVKMVGISFILKATRKFAGLAFSPSVFEMGAVVLSVLLLVLRQGWTASVSPVATAAAFYFNSCPLTTNFSNTTSKTFSYRFMALFVTAWSRPNMFLGALISFCVMLTK
jgi:hypothetical protein